MYVYEACRDWINSPEGSQALTQVLANVERRLKPAGAAVMHRLWPTGAGDTDKMMAAVDRAVELGVIVEVNVHPRPAGQDRVFITPRR